MSEGQKETFLIDEENPVEFHAFKLKEWEKFLQDKTTDELKKIHRKLSKEVAKQCKALEAHINNLDVLEDYLKEKRIKTNSREKEQKIQELSKIMDLIQNNKEWQVRVLQKTYKKNLRAN